MQNYFDGLAQTVALALAEDLGTGDLTANLIPESSLAKATIISREEAVICGRPWFDEVFAQLDKAFSQTTTINWLVKEGDRVSPNQEICTLEGNARVLLTGERTALNFLQTLAGTATTTAQYVAALQDSATQILDTRKTLPNLRLAQKYAVKCGGGTNHRIGLYDAILIKENHIMAAGSIAKAVEQAKLAGVTVEVEVESLDELQQALAAQADIVMLDNFDLESLKQAVALTNKQAKLEISGNIELENLKELANLGVDYISSGALTKSLQAIDLSMRFELEI